ncbi:hypothetical protein D1AOALGA4SA_118 [Olavius algarvensis Delta 1 endosymbiont]|nr:hypothetical protein D1AOALGA4SA_118 [Olavius algarvensis Delta 1 endosymbiont]
MQDRLSFACRGGEHCLLTINSRLCRASPEYFKPGLIIDRRGSFHVN